MVRRSRLILYVGVGVCLGLGYAFVNVAFDVRTAYGTLPSALAPVHSFVDQVLPLIAGGLLGLAVHYVRVRASLAESERVRATELEQRLRGVERDQAAWVLAASVLHDLRNPIHTLGLLLDELPLAASNDERDALLAKARSQIDRVDARLAELRKLPVGAPPALRTVQLDDVAERVAVDFAPLAERGGVQVSVRAGKEAAAMADPAYVRVILESLVQNAIESLRQHDARGRIEIDVQREGAKVRVRVSDPGPGPDPDTRKALFSPLRSTKSGGLGLGLSIARALARAMDGELVCEEGDRTAFLLELPAEAA
jgi:signal transduction histidine kinase